MLYIFKKLNPNVNLTFILAIMFLNLINKFVDIVFLNKGLVPLAFTILIVIIVNKKINHKDEGMKATIV